MTEETSAAEQVVRQLWAHLDAMRWEQAGALLADGAAVRYPDSGC